MKEELWLLIQAPSVIGSSGTLYVKRLYDTYYTTTTSKDNAYKFESRPHAEGELCTGMKHQGFIAKQLEPAPCCGI